MTWNDVLIQVVNAVCKLIITTALPCLFVLIRKKITNDRVQNIIADAEQFVVDSVQMVNQTFVDQLKKDCKFDAEAQATAFKMCFDNWMTMASDTMKEVIIREIGNLNEWLTTKIESAVAECK